MKYGRGKRGNGWGLEDEEILGGIEWILCFPWAMDTTNVSSLSDPTSQFRAMNPNGLRECTGR